MPLYEFVGVVDPEKTTTLYYPMASAPKVGSTVKDDEGVEWKRVFSMPQASQNTKIDPYNPSDFVEKTRTKKGTYGDLLDASKELSEHRAKDSADGVDPVQKKFFKDYKDKRHGVEHLREKEQTKVHKEGFTISYT